ncbi:MAG: M28 family metallopeptidase [Candidatus Hydrogenedentes bacterium]|nr:M28 family metallopeptidase [Candidatus Hydrogenedentota bacterium]
MDISMRPTPPSKSEVRDYSERAVEMIKYVLQNFGPREPGSASELKTQEFFSEELKKITPKVELQSFPVAPMGLLFFLPLTGIMVFFSSAVTFKYPIIGFLGILLSLIVIYLQFGRYMRVIDILLPQKESCNVVATLSPTTGIVNRRLILCGHADSAYEMRFNRWGTTYIRFAVLVLIVTYVILISLSLLSVYEYLIWRNSEVAFLPVWLKKISLILGSIYGIVALGFVDFTKVVPGANDNLSGSVSAIEVLRWFSNHPLELQNTELICLITGSEEAGLRGAYAYIEKEVCNLRKIPTAVIAIDTLGDYSELGVVVRDMNGLISHHKGVVSLVYQAGLDCGISLKPVVIYLGSSDATVFSKNRIPASALVAMDPSPAPYYHTRVDNLESLNKDTILEGMRILIQAVRNFDRNGLPDSGPVPIGSKKEAHQVTEGFTVG